MLAFGGFLDNLRQPWISLCRQRCRAVAVLVRVHAAQPEKQFRLEFPDSVRYLSFYVSDLFVVVGAVRETELGTAFQPVAGAVNPGKSVAETYVQHIVVVLVYVPDAVRVVRILIHNGEPLPQ